MPEVGGVGGGLEGLLVASQIERSGRTGTQLLEPPGQFLRVAEFLGDIGRQSLGYFAGAQAIEPDRVGEVILNGFQFGRVGSASASTRQRIDANVCIACAKVGWVLLSPGISATLRFDCPSASQQPSHIRAEMGWTECPNSWKSCALEIKWRIRFTRMGGARKNSSTSTKWPKPSARARSPFADCRSAGFQEQQCAAHEANPTI